MPGLNDEDANGGNTNNSGTNNSDTNNGGTNNGDLRGMVAAHATFFEILDSLRQPPGGGLPPAMTVLIALQTRAGIPFTETRELFEYFGQDWSPLVDTGQIEEQWRAIVDRHSG